MGRSSASVYAVNLALLGTHQVDAAFWREWEVFGVPGGAPLFLAFNVVALWVLSLGLVRVAQHRPGAKGWSLGCAATGALTVVVHAVFLYLDRTAFWTATSLMVFVAIAVTSALQAAQSLRREGTASPPRGPLPSTVGR